MNLDLMISNIAERFILWQFSSVGTVINIGIHGFRSDDLQHCKRVYFVSVQLDCGRFSKLLPFYLLETMLKSIDKSLNITETSYGNLAVWYIVTFPCTLRSKYVIIKTSIDQSL